ncbi:hypothetical protein GIB67_001986 [Kingdonia uniflora]|uniref:Uncharacterized protein n=1 Tax=Kingdonia uniflora TaxID=39325 RepID=A0A7J7M9Z4_9MAGN|nr:hypothetical protein GIB67_001986 [Kingdonia uniflora]
MLIFVSTNSPKNYALGYGNFHAGQSALSSGPTLFSKIDQTSYRDQSDLSCKSSKGITINKEASMCSESVRETGSIGLEYNEELDRASASNAKGVSTQAIICSVSDADEKVSSPPRIWLDHSFQLEVPPSDVDKVRCIIRNIVRDWAQEGSRECDQCYKPILEELDRLFPSRCKNRPPCCLVPGAGLVTLALEISCLGFISQGNKFSYYTMICSSFILNQTDTPGEWTIYPWVYSNCNSNNDQLWPVPFSDIFPLVQELLEAFPYIYGVDAVEQMLEDLIYVQDSSFGSKESITKQIFTALQTDPVVGEDIYESDATDVGTEFGLENSNVKHEIFKSNALTSVSATRPQQGGRMPGDAVLTILMQKVRSLDLSLAVLERYLEELNSRYGNIFKELDEEITAKDGLMLKLRNDMKNLGKSKEVIAKDVAGFIDWKYLISLQVDSLVKDNAVLRLEVLPVVGFLTFLDAHKGLKMLSILGSAIPYFSWEKCPEIVSPVPSPSGTAKRGQTTRGTRTGPRNVAHQVSRRGGSSGTGGSRVDSRDNDGLNHGMHSNPSYWSTPRSGFMFRYYQKEVSLTEEGLCLGYPTISQVFDAFADRGWIEIIRPQMSCYPRLVRLFYVFLRDVQGKGDDKCFKVSINGFEFHIGSDYIRHAFSLGESTIPDEEHS